MGLADEGNQIGDMGAQKLAVALPNLVNLTEVSFLVNADILDL